MKIHPAIVIVVAALTAVAIATRFWADGEALKYGGPSQLLSDPHGRVYIQIQNQLLEHTAEGEFVRRHDLGELGIEALIGAAAFFSMTVPARSSPKTRFPNAISSSAGSASTARKSRTRI